MSTIEKTKCDGCGTEVEDYYAQVDWIVIRAPTTISVTNRRESYEGTSGQARTKAYVEVKRDMHFCGLKCFGKVIGMT